MKRVYYRKLIRDKVPDAMRRKGVAFEARNMPVAEFKKELLKKVGEEASALPALKKAKDIMAELADVLDVAAEIQKVFKISSAALRAAQKENAVRKGGFKKRVYLEWSEDNGYKTNERKGT